LSRHKSLLVPKRGRDDGVVEVICFSDAVFEDRVKLFAKGVIGQFLVGKPQLHHYLLPTFHLQLKVRTYFGAFLLGVDSFFLIVDDVAATV